MNVLKNFFKRRTLIEKIFIGLSSIILILGIYDISTYRVPASEKKRINDTSSKNELPSEKTESNPTENSSMKEEVPIQAPLEPEIKKEDPTIILPNYTIAEIDNSNFGNCIRETLHIVVNEEYTKDQLFQIAQKEIQNYTLQKKVNALTIGFYESKNNIGKGYEMGRVEYVPFGDFSKASEVISGDYSKFQTVNLIEDKIQLNTKQDTQKPNTSNLDKIKKDFESVYSDSKVTFISKNGETLKIVIEEPINEFGLAIDEITLSTYLESSLENIGTDIKTVDITVKSSVSSAKAILKMDKVINSNLGKYFETDYIMENIILN